MGLAKIGVSNATNNLTPNVATVHEQITISSTHLSPAANLADGALHANTKHVWFQVNGADTRITVDQLTEKALKNPTPPSSTVGMLYVDGTSAVVSVNTFNSMRAVRAASTDVVMEVVQIEH